MFKLVIAGGREFNDYILLKNKIIPFYEAFGSDLIIISGCAEGADSLGEDFADEYGLEVQRFPADWNRFGDGAGYSRNIEMGKIADGVIIFWDGKSDGSKHMIKVANRFKLPYKVIRY